MRSAVVAVVLLLATGAVPAGEPPALGTGELVRHPAAVQALVFSPEGKYLFSGCAAGAIQVTEVASGKTVHSLEAPKGDPDVKRALRGVLALAVSADGTTLFSGSDCDLRVWDVSTGKSRRLVEDQLVAGLALSPDGRLLAAAGDKGTCGSSTGSRAQWSTSSRASPSGSPPPSSRPMGSRSSPAAWRQTTPSRTARSSSRT